MFKAVVPQGWAQRIQQELVGNILPFWMRYTVDEVNGGFYGALTNDLCIMNEVERSAVLCARVLWTYATAYRVFRDEHYLQVARHAYDYLTQRFWDANYGGMYWALDYRGKPVNDRKHVYAQAFAIYGLSEFYRATLEPDSLRLAQELFGLIETHTFDAVNQGNLECRNREWQPLDDMRLSAKDLNCTKSMNTLLHLMEAYTNLMRVWDNAALRAKQKGLVQVFFQHIVDPQTWHLKLFFDEAWRSLSDEISYGHNIEASWLLVEAAEVLGEQETLAQARATAVQMAQAVYDEGREADGSVLYELTPHGLQGDKHWWVQAEAVVGFYNAYQISGQSQFAEAAERCWSYIEDKFVDHAHGDWFKLLNREGIPDVNHVKVGPWECPYHHSRACFEMLTRLKGQ
jgi:mannobiose 2-epimerase